MTPSAGHGPWRVLVVDDEENLNWSLVNSLRKDGYAADGALTGEDALARLGQTRYDCVVSDVKMPGMDGFELLQWLRQHQPQTRRGSTQDMPKAASKRTKVRQAARVTRAHQTAYAPPPFG